NVAFKELETVRDDLERTEHQPQDYLTAHDARSRLVVELAGLEEAVAEVTRKIDHYAKRAKARPFVEQRAKIEARLRELPAVNVFPEGGIERLEMLMKQRHALREEQSKIKAAAETTRLRRLLMRVDSEECAARSQVIESLRTLVPRMEAA